MSTAPERSAGLWQKLAAANATIPSVLTKDARNDAQNYPYLSESQAVAPIRDALLAHGLVILVDEPDWPKREPAAPTKQGNEQHAITVCLEATVTCTESGERVSFRMFGSAIDRDGRGHASARTDALKGLRQAFALAAEAPEGGGQRNGKNQQRAEKPAIPSKQDLAVLAKRLGFTDEQRDWVIAAQIPGGKLDTLGDLDRDVMNDVLRDPAALKMARENVPVPA